jgi:hypothetical protein
VTPVTPVTPMFDICVQVFHELTFVDPLEFKHKLSV